ncbi:hypothetical protein RRG08_049432 [Elysia crispata]|uniref:Uncharacterized protein n=1 Tax=Elysia crispata TaxID=231223 RepID=A0AAE1DKZ3_9GAST|nr:hypothetical protein RRG08_049432 [Elysia crispata]
MAVPVCVVSMSHLEVHGSDGEDDVPERPLSPPGTTECPVIDKPQTSSNGQRMPDQLSRDSASQLGDRGLTISHPVWDGTAWPSLPADHHPSQAEPGVHGAVWTAGTHGAASTNTPVITEQESTMT